MGSPFTYLGIKECGCAVAAVVDNPAHKKDVARSCANFIKSGLSLERVPTDEARKRIARCEHAPSVGGEPEQGSLLDG